MTELLKNKEKNKIRIIYNNINYFVKKKNNNYKRKILQCKYI